jgi:AcrR family transcriptional regulator
MVASAATLIRERGAHSTAIADVLAHSGAPRGSAYHYFPGGRAQLLCEAVDYASDFVAATISDASSAVQMLDTAAAFYRRGLLDSDYRAGCPVLAVAVEAGHPDERTAAAVEHAGAAFDRWTTLITERLADDGVPRPRAAELATLVIAGLEGALVLARTSRDVAPLDAVHRQLRGLLAAATSERKPR